MKKLLMIGKLVMDNGSDGDDEKLKEKFDFKIRIKFVTSTESGKALVTWRVKFSP